MTLCFRGEFRFQTPDESQVQAFVSPRAQFPACSRAFSRARTYRRENTRDVKEKSLKLSERVTCNGGTNSCLSLCCSSPEEDSDSWHYLRNRQNLPTSNYRLGGESTTDICVSHTGHEVSVGEREREMPSIVMSL